MREPDWKTDDGAIKLYCGDCRDILPTIEDGTIEAVIVDIPYGEVNRDSNGLRVLDKGAADIETFDLLFVIDNCTRLAASMYVWCGTEQVSTLRAGFVERGLTTRMAGWEKSNPSPLNGEHLWLSSFECCVFARKTNAYFAEHCASPIWRGPIAKHQMHPTQKPVWLLSKAVKASAPEHGTCLDFCMGSGTTGIACVRLDRKFIGIEKERKYFDIAVKRITDELERMRLFEPPPKITQRRLL